MQLNILAFAVPLFLAFMALEYWVARKQQKQIFNKLNSTSNLYVGIAERLFEAFVTGIFYFVYDYLHQHFAIFQISPSWYMWIILLLCTDLVWYWYHRLGHEVNIFWGIHIVHHQSEDFNFTVSARITVFQSIVRTCFWTILPIIGFPAQMVTIVLLVHGTYAFFTHTQLIGNLGWLEYILVTPSHHRVHHASNEQYLDKNYSDVFIIWDKLFGTFAAEKDKPIYGLTHPLKGGSFLWQHFHYLAELNIAVRRSSSIKEKLKLLFGRPENLDPRIRPILERKLKISQGNREPTKQLNHYVVFQTVLLFVGLFFFLLFFNHVTIYLKCHVALIILITLINCSAIIEHRKWAFSLEIARLVIFILAAIPISLNLSIITLTGIAIVTLLYFEQCKRLYETTVFKSVKC